MSSVASSPPAKGRSTQSSSDASAARTVPAAAGAPPSAEKAGSPSPPLAATANSVDASTTLAGGVQLVLLQVWSRLATFVLNQLALRFITREVLGIVALEMELLMSTILFLSRECIRMALLRVPKIDLSGVPSRDGKFLIIPRARYELLQKMVNFAYVPAAIGAVLSVGIITLFDLYRPLKEQFYGQIVLIFCLASVVELVAEPMYVLALNGLKFSVRVRIEGAAVFVKCVVALAVLYNSDRGNDGRVSLEGGVFAFAWAQLSYGACITWGYVFHTWLSFSFPKPFIPEKRPDIKGFELVLPREITDPSTKAVSYFAPDSLSLAWTFAKQGLLKHLLTEGDKILSVSLITSAMQGDYALVEKYGSLVARIIFQPIEETGRIYFSKVLGSADDSYSENLRSAAKALGVIIRLHILVGLVFVCFGSNYAGLFIDILAGREFSLGTAPFVLATYCFYVPLMGINGITEAFFQGLADEQLVMKQSYWMIACWVIFLAIGGLSISVFKLAAIGIVLANSFNMAMRISFSWNFVRNFFLEKALEKVKDSTAKSSLRKELAVTLSVREILPPVAVWAVFGLAWAATFASDRLLGWGTNRNKLLHLATGVVVFAVTAAIAFLNEKSTVRNLK
ncbi:Rft protein-domain-containing protein, partial [Zopfochytrium polystomum]